MGGSRVSFVGAREGGCGTLHGRDRPLCIGVAHARLTSPVAKRVAKQVAIP